MACMDTKGQAESKRSRLCRSTLRPVYSCVGLLQTAFRLSPHNRITRPTLCTQPAHSPCRTTLLLAFQQRTMNKQCLSPILHISPRNQMCRDRSRWFRQNWHKAEHFRDWRTFGDRKMKKSTRMTWSTLRSTAWPTWRGLTAGRASLGIMRSCRGRNPSISLLQLTHDRWPPALVCSHR